MTSLKQSLQQVSSELDGYKQTAQTQDIQIAKLKKDAQRDMKRVKDLMEVGGHKFYPITVETVLDSHEEVLQVSITVSRYTTS